MTRGPAERSCWRETKDEAEVEGFASDDVVMDSLIIRGMLETRSWFSGMRY